MHYPANDRCWLIPEAKLNIAGVRCGHISAAGHLNLSVCFYIQGTIPIPGGAACLFTHPSSLNRYTVPRIPAILVGLLIHGSAIMARSGKGIDEVRAAFALSLTGLGW
jgi:hypothetical protein